LDVGCGRGRITRLLSELGHSVVGIDVSGAELEVARALGPQVRYEALSVYDDLAAVRPVGGFDVIVAAEVIEHLSSPLRFLLNMADNLKDSGAIILSTPYHGYLKNLLLSLTNSWDSHFSVGWQDGHVKFFSERSLSAMLGTAGFARPLFRNAGRLPLLWMSMVCRATKIRTARYRVVNVE
jgi:2-polyprenyl-3-methyl-5-hydroxy-6-metoxy-1,4-benzoquinol methylase